MHMHAGILQEFSRIMSELKLKMPSNNPQEAAPEQEGGATEEALRSPEKKQRLRSPESSPSPPDKSQPEEEEAAAPREEQPQPQTAEPAETAEPAAQPTKQRQQPKTVTKEPPKEQTPEQPTAAASPPAQQEDGVAANPTPAEAFGEAEPAQAVEEVTKLADVTGVQQVSASRDE